jgi:hypothetical protein
MSGSIDSVVANLLARLEDEGIHGTRAWFAERPHIVVVPDFDGGWLVVMTRGRITRLNHQPAALR